MPDTIFAGTVILREGVCFPPGVKVETKPGAPGWNILINMDGYGLGRAIREAGWNFFSLAHSMKISVIGAPGSSRLERAIQKLAARVRKGKFNAFEITEVSAKSFLGLPYANLSARSRHVQQSIFLVPPSDLPVPMKKMDGKLTPAPAFL